MIRFPLLPTLVLLALPAAGSCESIDLASGHPAQRVTEARWDPVVRGPAPWAATDLRGAPPGFDEPGPIGARVRFDATGESAETAARAAVMVVRGTAGGEPDAAADEGFDFDLALARMLAGICRLDPRYRDAAATDSLAAPLPARF
jgi:hypothetical protein